MSNDTIIVSLLTIFIVKNSHSQIIQVNCPAWTIIHSTLYFHNARKEDKSGRWEAALSVRPGS